MASIHVLGLVCFSLILSTHSVLAAIDYEQALTKPLAAIDYDQQALTKPLAAVDYDQQALTKPLAAVDYDQQALTKPLAAVDYDQQALTKPLAAVDYDQPALTKPLAAIDYEQALTKPLAAIDYEQAFTKSLAAIDYKQALTKSLLYFEAQRSGKLPPEQRVQWRGDSALKDGSDAGVDLNGGYYDAGDNVKFGFPMAFTITMLSWSTIEFASKLETKNELSNALDAIKWGTDYLIKAHPQPNVLYGEVGDGGSDHTCWQRPEDMTTPRTSFKIDEQHPGSDLAGETAAAFAAASIAFKDKDPTYSGQLLTHAKQLFEFARSHAGVYQNSINVAGQFYSSSGYEDELLWAAAWLHRATDDKSYLDYLGQAGNTGGARTMFSWDDKFVGAQVLVAKLVLEGKVPADSGPWSQYKNQAEQFICSCIQKGNNNVKKTPGGLLWFLPFNNLQYTATATLIATVYSEYLSPKRASIQCSGGIVQAPALLDLARSQVDYILGSNPNGMSYMVGFGSKYPTQIHHRGASIVSIKKDPSPVACQAGFDAWFNKNAPNPNVLDGAIVGGPNDSDGYTDSRSNFQMAEAATVNTAPLVGVLAKLA